jgi:hypothetical protein
LLTGRTVASSSRISSDSSGCRLAVLDVVRWERLETDRLGRREVPWVESLRRRLVGVLTGGCGRPDTAGDATMAEVMDDQNIDDRSMLSREDRTLTSWP